MEWKYFHRYNDLAHEGRVKFLSCPDCSTNLVSQMDNNADPVLWCCVCDVIIRPGLDLYDQIRAVVREHHLIDKSAIEMAREVIERETANLREYHSNGDRAGVLRSLRRIKNAEKEISQAKEF